MKKLLCTLLALVMLLSLAACGGAKSEPTHNDAGYYAVYSIDDGEDLMTADDFADLDWTVFLQLNEDGTGVLDMDDGDVTNFTWEDGSLTYEGEKTPYALAGGMLTLDLTDDDGPFVMIFRKTDPNAAPAEAAEAPTRGGVFAEPEEAPAEPAEAPAEAPAPAGDGLAGTYKLISMAGESEEDAVDSDAIDMMETLGLTVRLYLREDGTGVLDMYGEQMDLAYTDSSMTLMDQPLGFEVNGSTVTVDLMGEVMTFEKFSDDVDVPPAEAEAEADVTEPAAAETAESSDALAEADLDEYHVAILSAESFLDTDNKDSVRFYYEFTNNSSKPMASWWPLSFSATEDGYDLVTTYAYAEDDVPEYGNDTLDVLPGVTIRCIEEYNYKLDGSDLVFTITGDYDGSELSYTFDPANLPGRPGDWSIPLDEDPQFFYDYPIEGTTEYGYFAVTDAEYAEGDEWFGAEEVLRVYFDFTNLKDTDACMTDEIMVRAYQDGIQLDSGYPEEDIDSDDMYNASIPAGESTVASTCWEVRTDSPIEVVIQDWWTDEVICSNTFYPAG